MRIDNPLELLRQLKGAPLSIYLACQIARQAVSQNWLCEQTGYTDHAVTRALSYLTGHNYLSRVTGGWMISSSAVQLPLMAALPEGLDVIENDFQKNRDNRDFGDPIIIIDSSLINESLINNNNKDKNRDYRDSQIQDLPSESKSSVSSIQGKTTTSRSDEESAALAAALRSWAIIGKKAAELIACEWVSADYVLAHVEFAKAEEKWNGGHVGMAITRMIAQVAQPARRENGHIENCRCAECLVNKHVGGLFAEYVNVSPEDHADDCLCIACRRAYPERFCTFMRSDGRGGFWECDAYVEPEHAFCSEHEDGER